MLLFSPYLFSVNVALRTNSPGRLPQLHSGCSLKSRTKEEILNIWELTVFLGRVCVLVEDKGLNGGGGLGWLLLLLSLGEQGFIVFSGAQTVTAGMVSWCFNPEACRVECRVS